MFDTGVLKDRHTSFEQCAFAGVLGTVLASVSADIRLGTGAGEISYWKIRSGLEQGRRRVDNRCLTAICRSPDKTRHAVCKHARVIRLEQPVLLRLVTLGFYLTSLLQGIKGSS